MNSIKLQGLKCKELKIWEPKGEMLQNMVTKSVICPHFCLCELNSCSFLLTTLRLWAHITNIHIYNIWSMRTNKKHMKITKYMQFLDEQWYNNNIMTAHVHINCVQLIKHNCTVTFWYINLKGKEEKKSTCLFSKCLYICR